MGVRSDETISNSRAGGLPSWRRLGPSAMGADVPRRPREDYLLGGTGNRTGDFGGCRRSRRGPTQSAALLDDGSIVVWGGNAHGQSHVPAPNSGFMAVDARGSGFVMALRDNGSVEVWGDVQQQIADIPTSATGCIAIAARRQALPGAPLRSADRVVGACNPARGAGSAGSQREFRRHCRWKPFQPGVAPLDGRSQVSGYNNREQLDIPTTATNCIAIAAGVDHGLALLDDHSIVGWGLNTDGQLDVRGSEHKLHADRGGIRGECRAARGTARWRLGARSRISRATFPRRGPGNRSSV